MKPLKNKLICPACMGNGYRKIFKDSASSLRVVIDCEACNNEGEIKMTQKIFTLCVILITCTSCSEFALLASGSSIAISQNSYAKVYNGVDILTIMSTKKSMKRHVYDNAKKAWVEAKEGKKYIYDKTWGLTSK